MSESKTTLTIHESTRERIREYRTSEHDHVSEVLEDTFDLVPTVKELRGSGCAFCGETDSFDGHPVNSSGIIRNLVYDGEDYGEIHSATWFCSVSCLQQQKEREQNAIPVTPDEVTVGGRWKPRVEVPGEGSELVLHGSEYRIGFPFPNGFGSGWVGEPVYVSKAGSVRQSGIISDVTHDDDRWTSLELDRSPAVTKHFHPNPDKRADGDPPDYQTVRCPHCDEVVRVDNNEIPHECPNPLCLGEYNSETGEGWTVETEQEFEWAYISEDWTGGFHEPCGLPLKWSEGTEPVECPHDDCSENVTPETFKTTSEWAEKNPDDDRIVRV